MIVAFILANFIRLNLVLNCPGRLALLYTVILALTDLTFGEAPLAVATGAAVTLAVLWLFFALLKRYEDSGAWWVTVAIFFTLYSGFAVMDWVSVQPGEWIEHDAESGTPDGGRGILD